MSAYLLAAALWVVVWAVIGILMGPSPGKQDWLSRLNWFRFVKGQDGALSTSRFQLLLWMMAVMYGFLVVFVARTQRGLKLDDISFDPNILLLLGYSVTSAAGAAGITNTQVQNGTVSKAGTPDSGPGPLFTSDAGQPDIGKIQLLGWNLVAVGIFLYLVLTDPNVTGGDPQLPGLGQVLMVLVGLSHAAYLGGKLVTSSSPRFFQAQPAQAAIGDTVTVTGASLGTSGAGSTVMVKGTAITDGSDQWGDTQLTFTMPGFQASGAPWPLDEALSVTAYVGGQNAVGKVTVQVAKPLVDDFSATTLAPDAELTIVGKGFGPASSLPDANVVRLTSSARPGTILLPKQWVTWSSTAITIKRSGGTLPEGVEANTDYTVSIVSYGHESHADPPAIVRFG